MTNVQLYLAVGMPTLAILAGILINGMQFAALRGEMQSIRGEMQSLSARLTSVETRLDMLLAKVMDIDTRLTRPEERMERM